MCRSVPHFDLIRMMKSKVSPTHLTMLWAPVDALFLVLPRPRRYHFKANAKRGCGQYSSSSSSSSLSAFSSRQNSDQLFVGFSSNPMRSEPEFPNRMSSSPAVDFDDQERLVLSAFWQLLSAVRRGRGRSFQERRDFFFFHGILFFRNSQPPRTGVRNGGFPAR